MKTIRSARSEENGIIFYSNKAPLACIVTYNNKGEIESKLVCSDKYVESKACYPYDKKSIKRFHAAEHMAINAYEKLQRVPTLEEIKKASRFHERCGSLELIMFNKKFYSLFKYFQILFTAKPTDKELKLAIVALQKFEEMENLFSYK